ncbi:MAG TPA: anti-sigma factor, partial [Candidatus Dormibacteraeota bacterium]
VLAAHALDSLDQDEAERVEGHLAGCAECRAEFEGLRALAMEIGTAVDDVSAPPELRGRILARARADVTERRQGEPAPAAVRQGRRTTRWSPWLATAAAALLALSAGGWGLFEHFSGSPVRPGLAAVSLTPVERLIAAGDATVLELKPSGHESARGALVSDPQNGVTYLLLSRVPALHSRAVYALWYMAPEGGSLTPVRIGQVDRPGAFRVSRGSSGFTEVAVTREPHHGDTVPEGPVLLAAALS